MTPDRPYKRDHRVPLTLSEMLDWTEETPDGCRLWIRSKSKDGYGKIQYRRFRWSAHRLAWTLSNGDIPDGMTVDHLCFQPACINPAHMQLLTPRENSRRRQQSLSDTCTKGHLYQEGTVRIEQKADGRVARRCMTCANDRGREYWAARAS